MSVEAVLVPGFFSRFINFGLQTGDSSPPVYVVSPIAGAIGSTTVQVTCEATDDNGPIRIYLVALADGATAPSAAQVAAGTDSTDTPAPKATNTASSGSPLAATVAGLTASTAYDVFAITQDAFANRTTVTKIDVTTAAAGSFLAHATTNDCSDSNRMVQAVARGIAG